jgi:hypothetical protein
VEIQVYAAGYPRHDKVVASTIDFTQKLQDAGLSGTFDEAHLRVLEGDASGLVLDDQVPFQFDRDPDYQANGNAVGQVVLLAQGQTGPTQTRRYYAYFDTLDNNNGKPVADVNARISYQDDVQYEEQKSYAITTENATYYYHKRGAGFASMVDGEENDWVSYHPTGDAAGNYRGLPNVATKGEDGTIGLFHPGYSQATSTILNSGPIRLTIESESNDGDWAKIWEIYPQYATMTLLRKPADKQYWVLYEGTPGGSISEGDYYVPSNGTRYDIYSELDDDLPGEEWVYFGDDETGTVLYLVNHQEEEALDCHYVLHDSMTVFGFGRDRNDVNSKHLDAIPGRFTFGFTGADEHQRIQEVIHAAYMPLDVVIGSGEHR